MTRRDRPPRRPRPSRPEGAGRPEAARRPEGAGRPEAPRPSENILYGRNPVHEALRAGRRRVHRVWATTGAAKEPWLQGVRVDPATGDELTERAGTDAHQGMVASVDPYPYVSAGDLLAREAPLLVALDEVQDPQNLGAIARSAEGAGADGLIIPERRSAEVTAAAAKASAGAVEHLPVARVKNLADFLVEAKGAGAWVYGAEAEQPSTYLDPDYTGAVVLVLGAEGKGLRPRVAQTCDLLVSLPLQGHMQSLNVSAAAAVLLFNAARSRTTG